MSHWIRIVDVNGEICEVASHQEGGTYVVGGTNEARLNMTYNYFTHIEKELGEGGVKWLYGKQGRECIPHLEKAIKNLGTARNIDYWKPTAGNAGYALSILLVWAKEHPEGIFEGD